MKKNFFLCSLLLSITELQSHRMNHKDKAFTETLLNKADSLAGYEQLSYDELKPKSNDIYNTIDTLVKALFSDVKKVDPSVRKQILDKIAHYKKLEAQKRLEFNQKQKQAKNVIKKGDLHVTK